MDFHWQQWTPFWLPLSPADEPGLWEHAEVNRNKVITTLILWIYINLLIAALGKICARAPAPQAVSIHQIRATGGLSGSTTMVMVFVRWFVLFVCLLTHDSSVGRVLPMFQRCYKVSHPGLHHTCVPPVADKKVHVQQQAQRANLSIQLLRSMWKFVFDLPFWSG
jgi:hypothetical protein